MAVGYEPDFCSMGLWINPAMGDSGIISFDGMRLSVVGRGMPDSVATTGASPDGGPASGGADASGMVDGSQCPFLF
jgi:hypothetical protein